MADRSGFDPFVVARLPLLLRMAYLLTRDQGQAEDLLHAEPGPCRSAVAWLPGHGVTVPRAGPVELTITARRFALPGWTVVTSTS